MDEQSKGSGPKAPEDFGIADLISSQVIDHKSGHDQSPPPSAAKSQERAEIPPYKPNAAPKSSLAERLRKGPEGEENSK